MRTSIATLAPFRRVADPIPKHALGWHILWMKPDEFRTHAPVSPTATFVVEHLSEDLFTD